jgi:hypothetical protein
MRIGAGLLVLAAILAAPIAEAHPGGMCWRPPQARTVEEAVIVAQNEANVAAGRGMSGTPAMLALSDGRLKTAYSAGLIVGWGETGKRPAFSVVTAVGMSALLAPFAFIGRDGDGAIADIFACDAASLEEMAARAIAYLDGGAMAQIARRHEAGARLLVALPGSAARRETVWDIGAIAASGQADAGELIGTILRASVDLTTFVDPQTTPVKAGVTATRNPALRRIGAGEAFLSTPSLRTPEAPTYLIHNGVLFADEAQAYGSVYGDERSAVPADLWLLPAHDLFRAAHQRHRPVLIASPRAHMNIQTQQSAFDLPYMRALFLDAFRQGRMSREWRETVADFRSQ